MTAVQKPAATLEFPMKHESRHVEHDIKSLHHHMKACNRALGRWSKTKTSVQTVHNSAIRRPVTVIAIILTLIATIKVLI